MTYDQANQLASRTGASGTLRYEYDHAGRLIREHGPRGGLTSYEYGYLDKVMAVERDGQRVRYHYDGTDMPVAKEFPDGPNQHFYAPVPTTGIDPWGLQWTAIFSDYSPTPNSIIEVNGGTNSIQVTRNLPSAYGNHYYRLIILNSDATTLLAASP